MRKLCAFVTLLTACAAAVPASAETATTAVVVRVTVASRTSLRVSNRELSFDVERANGTAVATVDFFAGARVNAGGGVVLSVEPVTSIDGPGGAADVDAAVTFSGDGDGTLAGSVEASGPTTAGQWRGSGVHRGRLVFTLHAAAPGHYDLPVRFVLSTP